MKPFDVGSGYGAPCTRKMSKRPSLSQSKSATPDPMVSIKYFREVWGAWWRNFTPDRAVISTKCAGTSTVGSTSAIWAFVAASCATARVVAIANKDAIQCAARLAMLRSNDNESLLRPGAVSFSKHNLPWTGALKSANGLAGNICLHCEQAAGKALARSRAGDE